MTTSEEICIPTDNFSLLCRLCLTAHEKLFQLFRLDELETAAVPFSMKVTLCTTIRVSKFDLLPQKICQNCLNYVNEWFKFRKKCMKIDAALKEYVTNQNLNEVLPPKDIESVGKFKYCNIDFDDTGGDERLNIFLGTETSEQLNVQTDNGKTDEEPILMDLDQCTTKMQEEKQIESEMLQKIQKPLLRVPTSKFKCTSCPDSFYYLKDLKQHRIMIHKHIKSEKSTKKTSPVKEVEPDLKMKEASVRTRYEMKCCDKIFFSKARFRRHYNKKHPGEKPFMCETCGKKDFISEETLKRHKVLHTGKFRCEICSKTFTCNAILIIHKRDKHENDKPFICDVCGKRFVTELLMNYHKRFHTGEKKYVCEECGLAVVTSSSLAKHKRIHSNVKPHICQICGKGFIIKGRLVEHLRVHTGERPYSCNICHKGFTMRDKLKRHVRIHSGEKLFSCEYCGNNYSTSYGLSVHLKSHIVRNY